MADPSGETRERERDVERFLTFVDAIVAIAITLLVLPLVDLTTDVGDRSVAALLREHHAQFWSFLLSFAVIARLWLAQRHAVTHLARLDLMVIAPLLTWALAIVFLPFPTALVAQASDQTATKVLYLGTFLVGMSALAVVEAVIVRRPELGDGLGRPPVEAAVVNVVLLAVALAVAVVFPATGYAALVLLAADEVVLRGLRRLGWAGRS